MDIKIINSKIKSDSTKVILCYEREYSDYKYSNAGDITYVVNNDERIILVNLGEENLLTTEKIRNIAANIVKGLNKRNIKVANFNNIADLEFNDEEIKVFVEGLILGNYKFDKFKTEKQQSFVEEINLLLDEKCASAVNEGKILAECNMIARDLVNEPANHMYPEILAEESINLGIKYGFETIVYDKKDIERLNMEAFLTVAQGSDKEPKLIVLKYIGDEDNDEKLGLVGKGVTFDSGGYSLKSKQSMVDMKNDMGGAAAVIGAMCAIAKSKIKRNVIAVIPICENLISSKAYKPGDIITSMAGKTIEILNTDCEGRLALIDSVHYIINNLKVSKVVTIATLTGSAAATFGNVVTPVISNNDDFYEELEKASYLCDEKIWRLPNFKEYKELIIGNLADLKNTSGKQAGCITAGLFIGEFVNEVPWVHMDIAGTVFEKRDKGYKTIGATGHGAKTLYSLAKCNRK